ncbi:MAG: flagellar basal body L-ring protein FlgH [Deltaproteobacteria bacterium]|nr:flagellar basal body L-ring protein FlgH [Deltaproteobacteria bacterium]
MKQTLVLVALIILLCVFSGCAKLFGELRKDFDDSAEDTSYPTTGGRWTENNTLSVGVEGAGPIVNHEAILGHSERSPASYKGAFDETRSTWISPEQADANKRDVYRQFDQESAGHESPEEVTSVIPQSKKPYKFGERATRADFWDDMREGSLWAPEGQTNFFFNKNKVRGSGDIVTIQVEKELAQDTITEISRTLSNEEKVLELASAQERIRTKILGLPEPTAKSGDKKETGNTQIAQVSKRAPAAENKESPPPEEIEIPKATAADIDVSKSVEFNAGEHILAEIVERYPNGNYKIRGTKRIRYRNNPKLLTLVGVVKGVDITEEDTLNSGRLYEYRLEILR